IHDKPDSQEVCFVGASHNEFLKKYLRPKAGEIRDEKGKVLGTQQGLPFYTLGQRSGLGLSGGPWYVSNINNKKNILIVTRDEKKSKIFGQELIADKISWISSQPKLPLTCQAQIRYHAQPAKCKIEKYKNKIKVKFVSPQRAIMPGQSVVFYNGDELLGGGVIS
ncbi:MAG: aminomethyltransferase beta-barrel domain-containing protein, partial [bacterium]